MARILVVDDESEIQLIITQKFRAQIREQHWQFEFARNGRQALDMLADVDVVLTDLNMPVMDGLTFLQELHSQDRDIKAVVISAYGDMDKIRQAMNLGAFDFITKPFNLQDLATTLTKTVDLAQSLKKLRQLEFEKLAAEAASRAKSRFLAETSHELRTPLNAIMLYTELLMSDEADARRQQDLHKILGASRHLLSLINDLVDFSRLESGALQVLVQTVPLAPLLADMVELVRDSMALGGNQVVVHSDADSVLADGARVRQCLFHLLTLAARSTQHGTVTVETRRVGDRVHIGVSDTGDGMTPQQLEDAFHQLDGARRHGNTGLGLTITRSLCEAMGGRLQADSQPGLGSSFTLELPAP